MSEESTVDIQGSTYKIGRHGMAFVRTADGEWRTTTRDAGEIRRALAHKETGRKS